jgi:hypothetical protein
MYYYINEAANKILDCENLEDVPEGARAHEHYLEAMNEMRSINEQIDRETN